ncbi:MAG: DUF4394 domain-containing protein [Pseudomonadota bacterium]
MRSLLTSAAALAVLSATPAASMGHAGIMGYALANDGMTLVTMQSIAAPGEIMTFDLAEPISAIAYRPVTGELYGIAEGKVVTIDPMSGAITDTMATFADDATLGDGPVAFDFNNAIDAVRAVSASGSNLVYFPDGFGDNDERAGSVLRFTDPFYAAGDTNEGQTPEVFANAYTNAVSMMTAGSTFQYGFDSQTNALVSLANNAGTLETVGFTTVDGETVDLIPSGGFDIVSPEEGTDLAFAILQFDGAETAGLYQVDLTSGALTPLADLGTGGFTGFAISMGM